jgi:PKD repeat protein
MRARTLSLGIAVAAVVCALVAPAPPAQAIVTRTDSGRVVSYQPTAAKATAERTLLFAAAAPTAASPSGSASAYKECASSEAVCLSYHGGPVMRTASVTPVFWDPKGLGLSYPSGYQAEVDQFLTDLAADSGKQTDFYSVLPQYYETTGGVSHIQYSVTTGAPIEDTDALPSAAADLCATPYVQTTRSCVQDNGVRAELESLVAKDNLPTGIGHEYVVFFPPGLDSCFNAGGSEKDTECSGTGYCGYHGTIAPAGASKEFEYANEPDNGDPQYKGGCTSATGLTPAAITLSSTSHEISESVTDPEVETTLSWYDEHKLNKEEYGEVGDICAYEYAQGEAGGALLSGVLKAPAGNSNQTINGHAYLLQDEWDNAHSTCSISERTSATKALFGDSTSAPVKTGEAITFDGSGSFAPVAIKSYSWEWGDGTSSSSASPKIEHTYASSEGAKVKAFTVKLTVTDEYGNSASISHIVEIEDRPPTAAFTAPPTLVAGTPASFDASGSKDPDGTIASYSWEFGDGTATQTGETTSHSYTAAGEYTVTLRVTDDAGETTGVSRTVTVNAPEPPPPTHEPPETHEPPATHEPGGSTETPPGGSTSGNPGGASGTTGSTGSTGASSGTGGEATAGRGATSESTQSGKKATPSKPLHVTGVKQNRRNGSVALRVSVPGAGTLSAREVSSAAHASLVAPIAGALTAAPAAYPTAFFAAAKGRAKTSALVKAVSVRARAAGTATLQIVPTGAGRAQLARRHKLIVRVLLAFVPAAGAGESVRQSLVLALTATR